MKKVFIAIDYNPSAEKVAETGYALARAMHAEVTLIHVFAEPAHYALKYSPIMGYQGGYTTGVAAIVAHIKKQAKEFLTAAVKHLGDNTIKTKALAGKIEDAILQYGKSRKADLIVMGSHSHKGIDRLFVTDLAAHVLKQSTIPLLIIPTLDQ